MIAKEPSSAEIFDAIVLTNNLIQEHEAKGDDHAVSGLNLIRTRLMAELESAHEREAARARQASIFDQMAAERGMPPAHRIS